MMAMQTLSASVIKLRKAVLILVLLLRPLPLLLSFCLPAYFPKIITGLPIKNLCGLLVRVFLQAGCPSFHQPTVSEH